MSDGCGKLRITAVKIDQGRCRRFVPAAASLVAAQ